MNKLTPYRIYLCGPTVYDQPHIGNMKPVLTFDILARARTALGFAVEFVHNITDIDDKIIVKAQQLNISEKQLADRYFQQYQTLLAQTNVQTITALPRVTAFVDQMIAFIKQIAFATYQIDSGLYFDLSKVDGYGTVARRNLAMQQTKAPGAKKNAGDFAIWKTTTVGVKYDAPWGQGRPGWHTECAAFVAHYFDGQTIELHGGGIDLIFPHHENENIIFKAATGMSITKQWLHTGMLSLAQTKMSKSRGNIITATTFLTKYGTDSLRMLVLLGSVTAPLALTPQLLDHMVDSYQKLVSAYKKCLIGKQGAFDNSFVQEVAQLIVDYNWAQVRKVLFATIKAVHTSDDEKVQHKLRALVTLLGFNLSNLKFSEADKKDYRQWQKLVANQDYTAADKLRTDLQKRGII